MSSLLDRAADVTPPPPPPRSATTGRSPRLPLESRRTEASLFRPTISASPSARAASSRATCPTCKRSNTPLVNTTGPACRRRQCVAASATRIFSAVLTGRALQRLGRPGMERERMREQRQRDGLGVFGLDHDLARRRPARDANLLRLGRKTDVLRGRLDTAPDRAVVQRRRQLGLGVHLVQQTVVAEEHLADVDAVVQGGDVEEEGDETTHRARTPQVHHCDCAPSTRSRTRLCSASLRPSASWRGRYWPTSLSRSRI